MNQKGFVNIAIIIGIVILVGIAGYFVAEKEIPNTTPTLSNPTSTQNIELVPQPTFMPPLFLPNLSSRGNLTIESEGNMSGIVGQNFRVTLAVKGGTYPYVWKVSKGTLPPGLVLNEIAQPGCIGTTCPHYEWIDYSIWIEGIATKVGNYSFEINVRDSKGNVGTATFSSTITSKVEIGTTTVNPPFNSPDCGKMTFVVIAGGPSGPYGDVANARAIEYFKTNGLTIEDQGGSRFVVQPANNAKTYWMKKIQDDGIGSTQYDNVGCDFIQ